MSAIVCLCIRDVTDARRVAVVDPECELHAEAVAE